MVRSVAQVAVSLCTLQVSMWLAAVPALGTVVDSVGWVPGEGLALCGGLVPSL